MKTPKEIFIYFATIIKRFIPLWHLYGFSVAYGSIIFPFCHLFNHLKPHIAKYKHHAILLYLRRHYNYLLDRFIDNIEGIESTIGPDSVIWVCWWDGEEYMPPLVKACYNSIKKYAGVHPVKLITKHNFNDYVSIPEFIIEKLNSGIITLTHFSNILRVNLLYNHGGTWMDATILTLKNISIEHLSFYSLKAPAKSASVTLNLFEGISNIAKPYHVKQGPPVSRWSGFLLAGTKYSPIFAYLKDILNAYWKDHDDQIDYLLFDYTIALGYDNIPIMKKLIDKLPCSDVEKFELEKNLNNNFSYEQFNNYAKTTFHKLTWKKNFNEYTKDNKLTIYGHIINSFYE